MKAAKQSGAEPVVLLASARNSPVAARMAIRFAECGCRVAAAYPSKALPLASTRAINSHFHFSMVAPQETLLSALRASGADLAIPCDGLTARHLRALFAALPSTAECAAIAATIERSLGDPTAYLLVDSRHEVLTAARAEGQKAAESFAIGMATDPAQVSPALPFPWLVTSDYSWGGPDSRVARNLDEARRFISREGAPPSLAQALRRYFINRESAAMGEWLHAKQPGMSVQRPIEGAPARAVVAAWQGEVLAQITVEVVSKDSGSGFDAVVRIIDNAQMESTARHMAGRLGLSGFHSFDFVLEHESGNPVLVGIKPYCVLPAHVNAGEGHELVGALCTRWLGSAPANRGAVHRDELLAYFPRAWIADPANPVLGTSAYDIPPQEQEPELIKRTMQLARRERKYLALKLRLGRLFGAEKGE